MHAPFTSAPTSDQHHTTSTGTTSEPALTHKNLAKYLQHSGQPWNDPNTSHLPRQERAVGIMNALKSFDNNLSHAVIGKATANSDGMAPMERYLGKVARPPVANPEHTGEEERNSNPTDGVAYY
jgi:hypothetical protein